MRVSFNLNDAIMKLFLSVFRRNVIQLVLIAFPTIAFAQDKITGTIYDAETGVPVAGAVVQIDSTFYTTTSDLGGHFSFSGLKVKQYHITVSHISFVSLNTFLEPGVDLRIKLSRRTYLSEEVNISANRTGSNSTFAFSLINKKELEKNNLGKDMVSFLNFLPSVVTTSDAGNGIGYSGIRIRGSDATRVNVTINGIPVNDAESHQVYWVDLPDLVSSVEDIQVQRGIGSSTNGSGAFGGSINIQTHKLSVKPYAKINSSAGSFNTFKNTIAFGSGLLAKYFSLEGRVSKITSDGYVDRATGNLRSFFVSGGYYGKKNSLRAVVFSGKEKTYQSWYGLPENLLDSIRTFNQAGLYFDVQGNLKFYENQTDNYRQDNYQLLYSHEFNSSLNANLALHYTKGKGYYEEYKPGENFSDYSLTLTNTADTSTKISDLIRQLWLSNDFYGLTWSVNLEKSKWNLIAGGAASIYSGKHFGKVISSLVPMEQKYPYQYYADDADKTDANVFIRGEFAASEKMKLYFDVQERAVHYSYTYPGIIPFYLSNLQKVNLFFFNPKAGFNYLLSPSLQAYISAGVGHKEPVRDDYVSSFPPFHPEPESMIDYEAGLRYNSGKLSCAFNAFYMDYKSQLILNGKINTVGEYIRESVRDSYRTGGEMEVRYNYSAHVNLKGNLTLSKNRIKKYFEYVDNYDGGPQIVNIYERSPIAFSPEINGGAILEIVPVKNSSIGFAGKYVGKQYLDNTGNENRKLEPYFISDLYFSYSLHPRKMKEISFHLSFYNLFNTEYISNGYTYSGYKSGLRNDYNFYYPQAKINWLGGIIVSL
jgi:iron complex outermembrane receptor protein